MKIKFISTPILAALLACGCAGGLDPVTPQPAEPDPPPVTVGERFFLEPRFAQFFAARMGDSPNRPLAEGDPVLDRTASATGDLLGPFRGQSMSCRACHMVDELREAPGGRTRTYADFARRSPVPDRGDGHFSAARNSPALVGASIPRGGPLFLHFDGEFATQEDLVRGTLAGRNFGWLPTEERAALAHVARIVREDDGTGDLAAEFAGLPYSTLLAGVSPAIPDELRLPEDLRIDVATASDDAVVDAVARLVAAYVRSLEFSRDATGAHDGSPYDAFLARNGIDRAPRAGETALAYTRRLRDQVAALESPRWITNESRSFATHPRRFEFGARELLGLRIFLAESADDSPQPSGGVGACVTCHPAPDFTDFLFHDNGATQVEYDALHGRGAFAALPIPDLEERRSDPERFLPAAPGRPGGRGPFLRPPSTGRPGETDLGLWNVFANDLIPAPQAALEHILCAELGDGATAAACAPATLLPRTVARFKTPGLRDLGHSAPYLHGGTVDTLDGVVAFYLDVATLARRDELRNGAPEIRAVSLTDDDVEPLTAFLAALDEDYD